MIWGTQNKNVILEYLLHIHRYTLEKFDLNMNFYFLNVDISVTMHNLYLKLYRCIEYIAVEGAVSQIFDIGPSSFFYKI